MAKEILSIKKGRGDTEVSLRVPSFQNFGARMGALERESFDAMFAKAQEGTPPAATSSGSETLDSPIDNLRTESLEVDLNMDSLMADLNSLMPGLTDAEKDVARKKLPRALSGFSSMLSGIFEDMQNLKIEDSPPVYDELDFECYNHDLQALEVVCDEDTEWNSTTEAKLDAFLAEWPAIRPRVLDAICKCYEEAYPDFCQTDPILMPAPGAPQLVEDRVRITAIHLRNDGRIGLSGACTWEDEHALGVLLENGQVLDCGYADVASNTW